MKRSGTMWIRDEDAFMGHYFDSTGDRFEIEHLEVAISFCSRQRSALDIGAHYGSWSRYMSKNFRRVASFEPVLATFDCCVRNLLGFDNVQVHNKAVGDQSGHVSVGVGKMYQHPGMETVIGFEGDVEMITVDSLCMNDVDLIKIDVEGFELRVLHGAYHTLLTCKPVIVFEENIRGPLEHQIANGECEKYLLDIGAKPLSIQGKDHIFGWS